MSNIRLFHFGLVTTLERTILDTEMKDLNFNMIEVRQGFKTLSQPMKELAADLMAKESTITTTNLKWCLTMNVKRDDNDNIKPIKGKNQRQRMMALSLY